VPTNEQATRADQTDAVVPVTVGTVVWGVALVVTFLLRGRLAESGSQWWVWTCGVGFGLGLFGCWWVRRRRARLSATRSPAGDG
jgi:hypothetical protein